MVHCCTVMENDLGGHGKVTENFYGISVGTPWF